MLFYASELLQYNLDPSLQIWWRSIQDHVFTKFNVHKKNGNLIPNTAPKAYDHKHTSSSDKCPKVKLLFETYRKITWETVFATAP